MFLKIQKDSYVNLNGLESFEILREVVESGEPSCCIRYNGTLYAIGDPNISEEWCEVVREHVEAAISRGTHFFDAYRYCKADPDDTVRRHIAKLGTRRIQV